jgi:hypothetical protein
MRLTVTYPDRHDGKRHAFSGGECEPGFRPPLLSSSPRTGGGRPPAGQVAGHPALGEGRVWPCCLLPHRLELLV